MNSGDYSKNLRLLCDEFGTVADVCRGIGINRQQFNKYLSGKVMPDRHNQRKISGFFDLDSAMLYQPHVEFREARVNCLKNITGDKGYLDFFQQMLNVLPNELDKLRRYIGYYNIWFYSLGFDGYIVKSLVKVYEKEGAILTKGIEHLGGKDSGLDETYLFKYAGAMYYLNDRIFILDYETLTRHGFSMTILSASHRSKITSLHGVGVGVASRSTREPSACRTEWEFLGVKIDVREALKSCRLYAHDSDLMDPRRKELLCNKLNSDEFLLRGLMV